MLTGTAAVLGLMTALSTSWLHPRLRVHPLILVPAGLLGGWIGSMVLAALWQPVLHDMPAAGQVAGGATGGVIAALVAVIGLRAWKSRAR